MSRKLGINGLGRIAKLLVWEEAARRYFDELYINIGREVGTSLSDIALFVERDSTYGAIHKYLGGARAERCIENLDERSGSMFINGIKTTFLRKARNPANIGWKNHGVELVVDATGSFLDPTVPADDPKESLRGHLAAGAKKVVVSAPFKIKDKEKEMPGDAVTTVMGINDSAYDPQKHALVSNASCTTTCLAYMVKPLLDYFGEQRILSASMTTVHAATGSQQVLDRAPKAKATDLRKNRSVLNNIILTTTGAAKALGLVIPEMTQIGFIAESVRIPTNTGSLIILVVLIQDENLKDRTDREKINGIYKKDAAYYPPGYLVYTDDQNVSSDVIGAHAAALIEGHETHTRTSLVRIIHGQETIEVPITQAVIYGWYDNELGSYTYMLGDRVVSIHRQMQ